MAWCEPRGVYVSLTGILNVSLVNSPRIIEYHDLRIPGIVLYIYLPGILAANSQRDSSHQSI